MSFFGGGSDPDLVFGFVHELRASRLMRSALRPLFPVQDRVGEDVTVAASELITNAVSYTADGGELRVWLSGPIRIEVHDHSTVMPTPGRSGDQDGGHGLAIVDKLSAGRWGTEITATGKCVWAEFAREPPTAL